MLAQGSTAKFIELDQNDVVRRFIVPEIDGLEGRIQSLVKRYPGISLVRTGRAVVASEDGALGLNDGLQGVPSKVDGCFMVDLCGDHPVLGQGPARYSQELVEILANVAVETIQQEEVEQGQTSIYDFADKVEEEQPTMVLPTPPKLSLTEQLLKQKEAQEVKPAMSLEAALAAKKAEEPAAKSEIEIVTKEEGTVVETGGIRPSNEITVIGKKEEENPYSKRFPHLNRGEGVFTKASDINKAIESSKQSKSQQDLNAALEKARKSREESKRKEKSKYEISTLEPRPLGKIDMVLEKVSRIEEILTDGLIGGEVTGEDLQAWFWEHVDTIGHEKTFAILAGRLKK